MERSVPVRMPKALLAATLLLAGALPACAPDAAPRIELGIATAVPRPCALVLWIDGLGADRFDALQAAGKLPNVTRYLIDRGVRVRGAVASYPTITYANNVSFNTGLLPGHHGILGNKWFDRDKLVYQDYTFIKTYRQVDDDFTAPTIHEQLGDDLTATILTPVRRGADRNIDNWATAGISWHFGMHRNVNRLTTLRFELLADYANRHGRWPKLIFAYFVTPDTLGHAEGVTAPPYTEMILDVDRQIGHICRAYEQAGLLDKTCITLISDHGFVNTPRHFDVAEFFRKELKVATRDERYGRDASPAKRKKHFGDARAVVVAGGNRRCSIHLRADDDWSRRPSEEEVLNFGASPSAVSLPAPRVVPALARQEAVELLTVRLGPGSVRVRDRNGAGVIDRITRDGRKRYRYRATEGTDPLGHASEPKAAALMDGKHHDAAAWLAASLDTPHPDAVVQLIEMNDSPRSGDVVLFAADGWDFTGRDAGGHGGLTREEILVPWVIAGPGLPAGGAVVGARTVDLMPTILHLIGRSGAVPAGLDGRSIADRLTSARRGAEATRGQRTEQP